MKVKFKANAQSYRKCGSVFSTTLEGDSLESLINKKAEFIKENEKGSEVITFGDTFVITTVTLQNSGDKHYYVDKTTNPYLMSLAREVVTVEVEEGLGKTKNK